MSDATTDLAWFRQPAAGSPGTINACFNAVDRHVVRGLADEVALVSDREYSYARLLTEVAAFAGALRAFDLTVGHEVLVAGLPPLEHVIATLACARLGLVVHDTEPPAPAMAVLGTRPGAPVGEAPVITADGSGELTWDTAMAAGRTDPAACLDVPGDAPLRVVDGRAVPVAAHLAAVAAGQVQDAVFGPLLGGGTIHLAG